MIAASFARWSRGGASAPRPSQAHTPAAALATVLVVGLIALGLPAGAPGLARPTTTHTSSSPTWDAGRAHSLDRDRPTELDRQIRPGQVQLQAARIQTVARTRRPDRIAADLDKAHARLVAADDELALAAAELADLDEAATVAGRAVKDARAVRAEAQEAMTAAELAMTGASGRLADLMAASEAAASARTQAAGRVERERVGSKAHRIAVTAWQMAAIADRAAHARQVVAEEIGAVAFEQLGSVAVTLAEAEISLAAARSGRAEAEQSAQESSARLADLEAQRQRLAAEVDALTAEAAEAARFESLAPEPVAPDPASTPAAHPGGGL